MSISVQGSPSMSRRANSTTDNPNHQDRAFILIRSMLGHMTGGMLKRKSGRGREKLFQGESHPPPQRKSRP